jgi:hypothetical protein
MACIGSTDGKESILEDNKMPCYKCNNNKYKYGERGRCVFDTLSACQAAERAIHAQNNKDALVADDPCDTCKKTMENSELNYKTI